MRHLKATAMGHVEDNNQYFKKHAPNYDRNTAIIRKSRHRLLELTDPHPGQTVLDVATGTGAVALLFAQEGCSITGVDLSMEMLEIAQGKNTYANLHFMQCDASKLPFDDNQFDIVTTSFALHDMPQQIRDGTVHEMMRVTKPNSTIAIMDYHNPRNPLWRAISSGIINLYEELEYRQFIKQPLLTYLESFNLEVLHHEILFLDLAQILVCRNVK